MPGFFEELEDRVEMLHAALCVGIDPTADLLGSESAETFSRRVIEETHHVAAAFKVNAAFFEAQGESGWTQLHAVMRFAKSKGVPVILDAKRGDIGSTSEAYAVSCFDRLDADAVTVNPYMGVDSLQPFLSRAGRGVFVLCKTSNPGSNDLQTLTVSDGRKIFEVVVDKFAHPSVGFVVGATDLAAIAAVRRKNPSVWILAPGLGAQGGHIARGDRKILYPVSRGLYANGEFRKNAEMFAEMLKF
jgi:uridine monophosphate synthetase